MKEKIEAKIEEIVNYIISKPESEITADDYMIIASEVRDIRFREAEAERQGKLERLLSMACNSDHDFGRIRAINHADCA